MAKKTKKVLKKFDFMNALKITGRVLYWAIFLALIFIAGGIAASNLNLPQGFKIYTVVSGSMEPAIHIGSVVVSQPQPEYKVGDVITFVPNGAKKADSVTHRIFAVKKDAKGATFFETKGDANKTPDIEPVSAKSVLGKEVLAIPYLGYPISFAKTRDGLIFLIIIPATLIIYSELISIKNETVKLLKERKKKLSLSQKVEVAIGEEEIRTERWYKRFFKKIFKK